MSGDMPEGAAEAVRPSPDRPVYSGILENNRVTIYKTGNCAFLRASSLAMPSLLLTTTLSDAVVGLFPEVALGRDVTPDSMEAFDGDTGLRRRSHTRSI